MKIFYRTIALGLLTIALIFTVSGCNIIGKTQTPTQTVTTGEILYSDSFSGTSTSWLTYTDDSGYVKLQDGALHVLNYTEGEYSSDTYPNKSFTDFILEVDMTFIAGSTDNWQSILARYSNDLLYYFDISADGYYAIGIWDDKEWEYTSLVETTYSDYILKGTKTNRVRVECIGTTLKLIVNGHLLSTVTDSTCKTGEVGLEVSSMDGEYTEVAFDNFVIYRP
jgi:hypothetical protein